MAFSIKQLAESRAEAFAKARKINDEHADENGNLPAEHQAAYDAAMKVYSEKTAGLKRAHELAAAEAELLEKRLDETGKVPNAADQGAKGGDGAREMVTVRSYERGERGEIKYVTTPTTSHRAGKEYNAAFNSFLKGGLNNLAPQEFAALRADDSDQAGYLTTPEQFAAGLLKTVDDFCFVRRYATVHQTGGADSLGIRKRTAKLTSFAWSSELAVSTEDSTLAFGKKVLTPHHLTGQIVISRDLLRRSVMPAESIIRDELARNAAEEQEDGFLTGTGDQQPLGVFVASNDGISTSRDSNTGSTTGFTADGILDAKYALKAQYRTGGERSGARWLFHRDAIKLIAKLKDGNGQYLLHPGRGLTGDEWDMLVGYPVDESERAPNTFTSNLYGGLLANWRYYEIADSLSMEVQVLFELLARTNQVVYIGRLKCDGMPTLEEAFVRLKCAV